MIKTYSDTAKTLSWIQVPLSGSCFVSRLGSSRGLIVSRLHVSDEIVDWLEENFGPRANKEGDNGRWRLDSLFQDVHQVYGVSFKYPEDAALFKITWL